MGDKEHAFKQIRHCTTWTNSLTKSSDLRFHALRAATYIQHCVSGNTSLQKTRSLSSHRVSGRPCRCLGAKEKLSCQFVTQPLVCATRDKCNNVFSSRRSSANHHANANITSMINPVAVAPRPQNHEFAQLSDTPWSDELLLL